MSTSASKLRPFLDCRGVVEPSVSLGLEEDVGVSIVVFWWEAGGRRFSVVLSWGGVGVVCVGDVYGQCEGYWRVKPVRERQTHER